MDTQSLIVFLIIGVVAGFLAGKIMKGGGFGLVGDLVLGVIGAFVGGWVFGLLGILPVGIIGTLITRDRRRGDPPLPDSARQEGLSGRNSPSLNGGSDRAIFQALSDPPSRRAFR